MQNLIALGISMLYICAVLAVATFVARFSRGASESSRKLVHILVGNWVFLIPLFTDLWALVLVPFTFIIVNSLSLKYKLIPAMERNDDSLGTVYYALSMFVLSGAGFIFGWRTLPFIGLLTMAYGDGLAAIIGPRVKKRRSFSFAPDKSLAGSLTVALSAFIVTALSLYFFRHESNASETGIAVILLIAALTAALSAFIELTGKRGCDNLSLPIGAGLFATLSFQYGSPGLYIYLLLSAAILITAYRLRAITADGIAAAFLTALTLYTLGDPWIGSSLLAFFILGSLVSRVRNDRKRAAERTQEEGTARNWKQVLCNSLPACGLLWLMALFPDQSYLGLIALAVFASAAADTFSSELGMLSGGRVFDIISGKSVQSGLSGGVTWLGLLAGMLGSALLSLFAVPNYGWGGMLFSLVLGFLGSVLDSVIGSLLQRKYRNTDGLLQDKPLTAQLQPVKGFKLISNNAVNLISLSVITISAQLICLFLSANGGI